MLIIYYDMGNVRANVKSMKLSDEVITFVENKAKEENRSFSNMVETMILKEMNTKK